MKKNINPHFITILISLFFGATFAQIDSSSKTFTSLKIKPSSTNTAIKTVDVPHVVLYDKASKQGKLLLFLPGTNGIPEKGPMKLFTTAIEQGYRVINLSYINTPAVARICRNENLINDRDCTEKFRTKRVFGTNATPLITDEPQDAIVPRLTKLLVYLTKFDKKGNWEKYLELLSGILIKV